MTAATADEVLEALSHGLSQWLDLSFFSGRWNLSHGA
jgi:hypothetical protein